MNATADRLGTAKNEFIAQWGALGTQWGINRTMAQIHALLMVSPAAMSTDQVMEELAVSRGNAHTNLKELVNWGLVRMVVIRGDRRDYYEAEKDVWEIFTIVARERKKREIEPALALLNKCAAETKGLKSEEAVIFHKQVKSLEEFVGMASKMSDKVASMKYRSAIQLAAKLLG
ncbi:MAG: GbsR/MarR family transcriptional regulator [Akkermansiaceae bacterium]